MKKVRVIATGRVQGVWFRAATRDKAIQLGVNGYVRNLANGNVEFVAEGDDSEVDQLLQWAWHGPPLARVDDVKVEILPYDNEYTDFRVGY
ncbi:MAG: acylphosphatase [Fidelibacterota bacterium]|nr:MAG: acylphosphatase [Candidatus Neomarinimicrobiota bacterium]